jgi:hypothetical protein
MKNIKVVAVQSIMQVDNSQDLLVRGKAFKNLRSAQSGHPIKSRFIKSLDKLGCYEAHDGLEESEEEWNVGTVVGKFFPFHMDLQLSADPLSENNSDQWWTFVRLKHTCPAQTL